MADPMQVENWSKGKGENDEINGILKVTKELTDSQIQLLIDKAKTDEAVKQFTHDPTRFTTIEEFKSWKTNKELYGMTDSEDKLYGIIWFEKMKLPDNETFSTPINSADYGITFAIRLYDKARGQGLTRKFMGAAFSDLFRQPFYMNEKNNGIWLSTSHDNTPAVKGYEHFGFKQITNKNSEGKISMVYKI